MSIPKLNIYLQRLILKQCWNHKFIEMERNNNGGLISWKINLCFVSKGWFNFIQSVLYDSYIITKPYEMVSNYKSKYSIFQTPPLKLEITSKSYNQIISHLTNEETRFNFFSNLQNLIFSFNTDYDIELKYFKYLFSNSKQLKSIKINNIILFKYEDGYPNKISKTNILEGLYQSLKELKKEECSIENLELNSFCYENEFKFYFEKLFKIVGANLKRLVINDCPTIEMIETIVKECNQYKLEELVIPSMYELLGETVIGIIKLLKQSILSKSLKSFSTSMISQEELHPFNFNHQVYDLFKEFLISMSNNLKHLSIALLNGLDKKGDDGGRFSGNQNSNNNNNKSGDSKLFELIKYILIDSSIESIEGDFIFSNYFLPLKEVTIKRNLKILGVDGNDNNEELINQITSSDFNKTVRIYIGFPSISTVFLQRLKCESILIDIFRNNNLNINQLIESIKKNNYLKSVEINFTMFSNLKNPISPLLLTQCIEILDSKNNNINHLILSLYSVKDVQSILKKFDDLKIQNTHSILMWYESTIVGYYKKKSINRDLKFYFENTFKLINN
ncbi:hypothetical protein ACTA71_007504 [Dictyostelium dimigraforme]